MLNRQWQIAERPLGRPLKDTDFQWAERPARAPEADEVMVRVLYLGFDPAQKGWMENLANYMAPTEIGQVMPAFAVGEVVASKSAGFKPGDKVTGLLGWQDYATLSAKELTTLPDDAPLAAYLGVLGTTGMTAFFGLYKIGRPFPGDTLVITGAAGGTGSIVGQIGKIAGCKVIGIAGGPDKCKWLTEELGFDAAIDYKAGRVKTQLKEHAPDGIDVLWDNVGGALFNDLLARLAMHARIVVCGGISRYETGQMPAGPENYFNLIFQRATMSGFIVLDYVNEWPFAQERIIRWIKDGRIRTRDDVQHGLERAPKTLMRLFAGQNFGKQILKVA